MRKAQILLFILFVFLFGVDGAIAEPRLALVIGNSQYTIAPKLDNPENDARLIGGKLEAIGFAVTTLVNLDYQSMRRALVEFTEKVQQAGPNATALVYYSGHGMQLRDQNYLIPVSAKLEREFDADIEGIPLNGILAYLENVDPHVMIVILDACRDNPLKGAKSLAKRGLARISTPRGSFIVYAAEPGSTAADGNGQNSPFTLALARYIDQPGLTIDQVFTRVRIDVNHDTGEILDILVQSRRDEAAALRLLRKLLKKQGFAPKMLVTDKSRSYAAARREL